MIKPDKPFMLLRHLPFYQKGDIKSKRFWMNVLNVQDDFTFDELIKKGWFK
jgi:hypothetical protein